MIDPARVPPYLGAPVHYVAYGTPKGEYRSCCRTAEITEVGAWVDLQASDEDLVVGTRTRTVFQQFYPEACTLFVKNPSGLFLNGPIHHRELIQPPDADLTTYPGGTWHWPCDR